MKKILYTLVMVSALFLLGCANAGKDQKVVSREKVVLDGSKSKANFSGKLSRYKWEQIKLNDNDALKVELVGEDTLTPSFMAPEVEERTSLYFRLIVTETGGVLFPLDSKDTVRVEVKEAPKPEASILVDQVPTSEKTVDQGTTLGLSAQFLDDNDTLVYTWKDAQGNILSHAVSDVLKSDGTLKRYWLDRHTVCDVLGWMNGAVLHFPSNYTGLKSDISHSLTLNFESLSKSVGGQTTISSITLDSDYPSLLDGGDDGNNRFWNRMQYIAVHEFSHWVVKNSSANGDATPRWEEEGRK